MISVVKMDNVPQMLCNEMQNFEKCFEYPLGKERSFTISHGDDYGKFFRSIGKTRIYLAKSGGKVAGSLAVVERALRVNSRQQKALYVGDLKIRPGVGGQVLYCLMKEAYDDYGHCRDIPHYSVVMKGSVLPSDYTGRLGLPKFAKIGEVAVLRIPVQENPCNDTSCKRVEPNAVQTQSEKLNTGDARLPLTRASVRSKLPPLGLMLENHRAGFVLEDTLEAKRLFENCGREIVTGHLSSVCYDDLESLVELLKSAMAEISKAGFSAVFLSVPVDDGRLVCSQLKGVHEAQANIFGRNIERNERWQINTSEI